MIEVASLPEQIVDPASEHTEGISTTRWHWLYLFANAPLVVAIVEHPHDHLYLWGSIGLCSAVAIVVGVLKNRPARRAPWLFIAIAQCAFVSGGVTYDFLTRYLHENKPFPSTADAFSLTTYPLLAIGLFLLVRTQSRERNFGGLLESLIVTLGMALLSWIYLIEPYVRAPQLAFLTKAVSMAYPIGDILILYILARLLLGGQRRNASVGRWAYHARVHRLLRPGGDGCPPPVNAGADRKTTASPPQPGIVDRDQCIHARGSRRPCSARRHHAESRRCCAHRFGLCAALHSRHAEDHRTGAKPSCACTT